MSCSPSWTCWTASECQIPTLPLLASSGSVRDLQSLGDMERVMCGILQRCLLCTA